MRPLTFILAILFLTSCGSNDSSKSNLNQSTDSSKVNTKDKTDWIFDKVLQSKLVFKGGLNFETNLFDLQYIGKISADNKHPF
jgi:major membrane immunogen (membrane-anchored lipoprotein)